MTEAEQAIAAGLATFPQKNLDRLAAHLAAGLPMQFSTGWHPDDDEPATCGCIMGVSFSASEAFVHGLISVGWPYDGFGDFLTERGDSLHAKSISAASKARLAEMVNAEMERRAGAKAPAKPALQPVEIPEPVKETVGV